MTVAYEEQSRVVRNDGDRVRARREQMGLNVTDMAKEAGVSRDTLSDLESGKRAPHPSTLAKVVEALTRLEEEMGMDAPTPGPNNLVRYVVNGVYGAESLVVEGPVDNIAELEESVDRIMRRIQGRGEGRTDP